MRDDVFAKALEAAWYIESRKANFSEVRQFRALMNSFSSLRSTFKIEEFHGMKHQVVFNGVGSWGRPLARCEISDLIIVSYKSRPRFEARVTLLQAKKSNEKHANICTNCPRITSPAKYKANLEQWDLLSRRPNVLPYPPFNCDPDILSGALLPSVGSIGVFYRVFGKQYNFFYMSADIASPLGTPKRKYAKLKIRNVSCLRNTNGYSERTFACNIKTFGKALYNLEIGTPVHHETGLNAIDDKHRSNFRKWLLTVIRSHVEKTDSFLAFEFMRHLGANIDVNLTDNPPSIVLINSDENNS